MQRTISLGLAARAFGQTALFVFAIGLAYLAGASSLVLFGLSACGLAALAATLRIDPGPYSVIVAALASLLTAAGILASTSYRFLEDEYLTVAWLAVLGFCLAGERVLRFESRRQWRALWIALGLLVGALWLARAYGENQFWPFHISLAVIAVLLILSQFFFRLPTLVRHLCNTVILFFLVLPLYDFFTRPSYEMHANRVGRHFYSFDDARQDPGAFAEWWYHFQTQWTLLHQTVATDDPHPGIPYQLKANSTGRIFESTIRINSLGFRGPEISPQKGRAFRIVALGESTTFGTTITADGKSWPRILEEMIRDRLQLDRPVEVINAGTYGFTIEANVRRFEERILPLQPDMVLSYHGYNYFSALNARIPPPTGATPPRYVARPLKILGDFEYHTRLAAYKKRRVAGLPSLATPLGEPLTSPYADAYRELIQLTDSHGIKLVLANYSMAVNAQSAEEVIEFYRPGFPEVRAEIQANELHSKIVETLARESSNITFVDTHPKLDGQHEFFIDLVHFTQPGREVMAEIFFDAIKDDLVRNVGSKRGALAQKREAEPAL